MAMFEGFKSLPFEQKTLPFEQKNIPFEHKTMPFEHLGRFFYGETYHHKGYGGGRLSAPG